MMLRPLTRLVPRRIGTLERRIHASTAWWALKPFKLADIGEGITECEIVKWHVEMGQKIEEFDPIVEVMSDKATVEITSPYGGIVKTLSGEVGDIVKVGKVLCDIETGEEGGQVQEENSKPAEEEKPIAVELEKSTKSSTSPSATDISREAREILATPAVRRMAREDNVDLSHVNGTGRNGRIMKEDIIAFVTGSRSETPSPTPVPTPSTSAASPGRSPPTPAPRQAPGSVQKVPLSPVRKAMFKAMTGSLAIPHFAYSDTLDVTALERLRSRLSTPQAKLTLLPFLLKALSRALESHPIFLSTLDPSGDALLQRSSHDISIALSAPEGGLYTPVIPSVDQLSPLQTSQTISNLQAVVPKFASENRGSGTITLSNVGVVGGRTTHPVIPPTGQLAIGAIGRVRCEVGWKEEDRQKAWNVAVSGGSSEGLRIEPRLVLDTTFTADHRVVEGVELARLVRTWKELVENPERLLASGR